MPGKSGGGLYIRESVLAFNGDAAYKMNLEWLRYFLHGIGLLMTWR